MRLGMVLGLIFHKFNIFTIRALALLFKSFDFDARLRVARVG